MKPPKDNSKDITEAITRPWEHYSTPEELLVEHRLTDDQKRRALESWEQDARELAVAEDENMGGGEPNMLDRVVRALATLPAADERPHGPATMHGSPTRPSSAATSGATTLDAEEARQGEIVLKTAAHRRIFLVGVAIGLCALVVADSLA